MILPKPPPLALLAMAATVQGFLSRHRRPTLGTAACAAPVAVASTWMLAGSLVEFARHDTSVDPVSVDRANTLVRTGPNAVTRNPMYVGMTGLLITHALLRRSVSALIPAAAFAAIINAAQIPAEERALAQSLPGYAEYAARVPRWLW